MNRAAKRRRDPGVGAGLAFCAVIGLTVGIMAHGPAILLYAAGWFFFGLIWGEWRGR